MQHKKFVKHSLALLFLGLCFLASAKNALADLKKQIIEDSANQVSVIVPVEKSRDSDYGVLEMSKDEYAKETELTDPNLLENKYFKMVEGESEQALSITDFDGRNVLYHMMIARKHYLALAEKSGDPLTTFDNKLTVRVRMTYGYNPVVHYAKWNDYNNSRYIPFDNYANKWGNETWFDARKSKWAKIDWYDIGFNTGSGTLTQDWLALGEPIPDVVNKYNSGIDSAKIPNVIYHETFHWASDTDALIPMPAAGNQVGEDYANYFGSSLLGRPEIAELHEFSGRFYKQSYKKIREVKDDGDIVVNPERYDASRFVPSFFWSIRNKLGAERADQLIWNSLKYLKQGFFQTRIPPALTKAAEEDKDLTAVEVQFVEDQLTRYSESFVYLQKHFYGNLNVDSVPESFTPAEIASITQSAHAYAKTIAEYSTYLGELGIKLDPEDDQKFKAAASQMEHEIRKPGFLRDMVYRLSRAGIRLGEGAGYALGATSSVLNAPVHFGTELAVAGITGHPLRDYTQEKVYNQFLGAGGGIGGLYYLDVGLSFISNPLPIDLSLTAITLAQSIVCIKEKTTKNLELKNYCDRNANLLNAINSNVSKAGDKTGEETRSFLMKIVHVFKKK
jgi:hypothetical protein